MEGGSAIEEIFGRFQLFGQDAYHADDDDDEGLDACRPVAADGIGWLCFVKVMLSSSEPMTAIQFRVVSTGRQVVSNVPCRRRCACSWAHVLLCMHHIRIFNLCSSSHINIRIRVHMLWRL